MADSFIRRADTKKYLKRVIFGVDQKIDCWIDCIPSADVRPVVRGRWVHGEYGPYCSNCDGYPPTRKRLGYPGETEFDYAKFCPNCGAMMDGEG